MDPRRSPLAADPLLRVLTARFGRREAIQRLLLLGAVSPAGLRARLAAARGAPPEATPVGDPVPPVAEVRPDPLAGDPLYPEDPYRWLEDPDDPATLAYLDAENAHTEAVMAPTKELQARLYDEILARVQANAISYPVEHGEYLYYTFYRDDDQFETIARRRGSLDAPEEIVLDVNAIASENTVVTGWVPSPDHRYLAYLRNDDGGISYTLKVRDIAAGVDLPAEFPGTDQVVWHDLEATLFYTGLDERTLRAYRVYGARVDTGAPPTLIHEEPDDRYFLGIARSKSGRYLIISAGSYQGTEVLVLPMLSAGPPTLLLDKAERVEATVDHQGDRFLVLTNAGAVNFRLVAIPEATPTLDAAEDVVPSRPGVLYDGFDAFERHVALHGYEGGMRQVWVFSVADGTTRRVPWDEEVHATYQDANPRYDTSRVRFTYTSLVTPTILYELDMDTMALTVLDREVVEGYDPSAYVVERDWATAPDGARVPISLLTHRDHHGTGPRATVVEAYGAYGSSYDPYYSPINLPMYDRGVGLAIAHVRGGSELGRTWYDGGRLLDKRNTFTDLVAVADHLIATGRTSPDKLCAWGASAGGLLMGVTANEAGDRFRAIVPGVAWLDVVRTMLDDTQVFTAEEWLQWGDPRDPVYYEYMASYDPYLNVAAKPYPHLYLYTGLFDDQVPYWNAAKWTAKLRATKTDDNLLILRTDLGSGHGGSSGRYDYYQEWAFYDAFLLLALGMTDAEPATDPLARRTLAGHRPTHGAARARADELLAGGGTRRR